MLLDAPQFKAVPPMQYPSGGHGTRGSTLNGTAFDCGRRCQMDSVFQSKTVAHAPVSKLLHLHNFLSGRVIKIADLLYQRSELRPVLGGVTVVETFEFLGEGLVVDFVEDHAGLL